MNAILRRVAQVTTTCMLLGAAAFAQTGTIEGDVKNTDGSPIKGAQIRIVRKDIKGNYAVKSDKKGHYLHAGLPIGQYRVALEVEGKEVDAVDNVRVPLGDPVQVPFNLKQAQASQAQQQQAIEKAMQSGQAPPDDATRGMSKEQKAALEKSMKERQAQMAKNKELNDAFNAGREAIAAKNYDVAVTSLTKASELDPNQDVVWANLADAYSAAGAAKTAPAEKQAAFDKGIEAYGKALQIKPADADYHNNFGLLLAKAGKFDQAMSELNKAAELSPASAGRYFFNLGAILTNAGQLEPAGEAFKKAIAADPNYADAHYQYGIYLVSKAKMVDNKLVPPEGTKEAFMKYLELKPDGPNAQAAKDMLTSMDAKIETQYQNPNAPKGKAPAKKGK